MKRSDVARILAAVYNVGLIVCLRPVGGFALLLGVVCAIAMLAFMISSWLYARDGQ